MVDAGLVVEKINADLATISDWSLCNGLMRLNSQKSRQSVGNSVLEIMEDESQN
jgi:hypothetical protein